jgi:hypothetical protein
MVVFVMTPHCTVVGEDHCWEEFTVSEFRVEVMGLILKWDVTCSLYLPTRLQHSLNPRDSNMGLICNETLETFC